MHIKIIEARRHIAKYQLHPIDRAVNELRDLGYTFTRKEENYDYCLMQTTTFGSKSTIDGKTLIVQNSPVILLDDSASTGTHKFRFMKWLPENCIGYIKKQLLIDRELYKIRYPRKRYHYYRLHKISNHLNGKTKVDRYVNDVVLSKVQLGWSLALMERPGIQISKVPTYDNRPIDIHYSVKTKHTTKIEKENLGKIDNHYAFHRVGCTLEVDRIAKKHNFSLSGPCKGREYLDKMSHSKVCISPLGLGEVCFRELESISHGAIFIKPDMLGIETWPDIYKPWQTYIPCKWDWSDLEEMVVEIITNYDKYKHIAQNAFNTMKRVWDNQVFATKFDEIMKKVIP